MHGDELEATSFVTRLQAFHERHFLSQLAPPISWLGFQNDAQDNYTKDAEPDEASLGHYADGNPRTLTDEQIAMFRHSEIQRLLAERRQAAEAEEDETHSRPLKKHKPQVQRSRRGSYDVAIAKHETAEQELKYEDAEEPTEPGILPRAVRKPPAGRKIITYDGTSDAKIEAATEKPRFIWPQLPP